MDTTTKENMESPIKLEEGYSSVIDATIPVYDLDQAQVNQDVTKATINVHPFIENTIPPRVSFRDRRYTDMVGAIIYVISYLAFIITGFVLVSKSKSRYEWKDKQLSLSDHYKSDLSQCCTESGIINNNRNIDSFDLCEEFNGRRLSAGSSKFHGDESMFDAFLQAPEIIVGLLSTVLFLSLAWVVLLRFFAKPIVILTELIKIAIFIFMGVIQEVVGTQVICFLIAAGLTAYAIWARKQIMFAAKVIKYSTIALKENPVMFVGCIVIKLFYVLNAYFFVLFFSKSFDVATIERRDISCSGSSSSDAMCAQCIFARPSYVNGIMVYSSLSYLWTVLLFNKMRLSVIATIVGSWHFHPEDKPGIFVAVKNTLTSSFGTLSVAALISAIAEKLNRMVMESTLKTWLNPLICITWPFQLCLCCFAVCLHQCIRMLTKFAVICHVFTGDDFIGSAKNVFKIMSRHFKGGFVTDLTSRGVLELGCYVFSVAVWFLAWWWIDERFDCNTIVKSDNKLYLVLWIIFGLFNVWYPVLGIYLIIIINMWLVRLERSFVFAGNGEKVNYQHYWIPPLAAAFVGCISMMFFTYISGIILDIIDTLFLCYAIDKDNHVDNPDQELKLLVEAIPIYEVITVKATVADQEGDVPMAEDPTPINVLSFAHQDSKLY